MQSTTMISFLHVLLAFTAIALLVIPGLMLEMVANTRDVNLIRRMFALGKFHGQLGGPIALLTAIAGLIAAWQLGVSLTSGWLIAAYIVFVLVIGIGIGYHSRRELKIGALAQASPLDAPSPELAAAIDDPLRVPALWVSAILWIALIWLMVVKPF
ncbi:MAG TPA: hypothetical protein VEW74_00440 [Candidatus Nitrosotalea sp.]|nr:hypothetical protein [Candidatus Nitrosotalea sp.]